jgi:LuxR family maltose regulon positive regulatory protein
VRRGRLEDLLDDGVRGPLTLVSAPAGTGKTVLVSTWVAGAGSTGTIVWLSLDGDAIGPANFWHLFVAGLARQGVGEPPSVSADSESGDVSFMDSIADRILAHPQPIVVVLDCDAVLASDVAARLDSLLRRAGGQLRVVLLAREDPLLPLHRYRLAGTMVEVRMADLAFTPDEARELLTGLGVDVSTAAMDAMISRTQGWAAGLRMAAMSMAHRKDREEAARKLAGDTGTVAEYLLAEVLDTQPEGVRRLLLDTSVVDVLRPGLAVALAGPHADRALSFLVNGNAFLEELSEFPGCYRYHHLFRELLRAQLAYESPTRSIELHRVAAAWLADHGLVVEAVQHAVLTGDWETAARFAVDDLSIDTLLTDRPTDALNEALAKIPSTADGPGASIVRAARALAAGDQKGADWCIRRASALLADAADRSWPAGELAVALARLVHGRQSRDVESALESASAATDLLQIQDPRRLTAHPELAVAISANLGAALVLANRLDEAAKAFGAAAAKGSVRGGEQSVIDALGHGALLAALRGNLKRSSDLARRAIRISSAAVPVPMACLSAAEVALAYVDTERYDLSAGRQHAIRSAAYEPSPRDPLPQAMLALVQARLSRAAGDLEGAVQILDDTVGTLPHWLADRLGLEKQAMLVAGGKIARAADLDQPGSDPKPPEAGGDLPVLSMRAREMPVSARVDALVESAARHARTGAETRAVRDLDHALRLAAPELSRRVFREAPEELRRLLRGHDELLARHEWLVERPDQDPERRRGPRAQRPESEVAPPERGWIYEPLTAKEREVLGYLSELLTTEEIAATMFISVNTVRTHVRNILRKLAASRRNEAVRRARDLALIPS